MKPLTEGRLKIANYTEITLASYCIHSSVSEGYERVRKCAKVCQWSICSKVRSNWKKITQQKHVLQEVSKWKHFGNKSIRTLCVCVCAYVYKNRCLDQWISLFICEGVKARHSLKELIKTHLNELSFPVESIMRQPATTASSNFSHLHCCGSIKQLYTSEMAWVGVIWRKCHWLCFGNYKQVIRDRKEEERVSGSNYPLTVNSRLIPPSFLVSLNFFLWHSQNKRLA